MISIDSIIQDLREGSVIAPGTLMEYERWCVGEFAWIAGLLKDILVEKATQWSEIRKNVSSDNQADQLWAQTQSGRDEIGYKWELKRLSKLISTIRRLWENAMAEAKSQI